VKEYDEQWSAKRQDFRSWIRDDREPRHVDKRPSIDFILKDARLRADYYAKQGPMEPEFT